MPVATRKRCSNCKFKSYQPSWCDNEFHNSFTQKEVNIVNGSRVIFTDREGDRLSVTPRDQSDGGNPIPDPVITIIHGTHSQSVVMTDGELHEVMLTLGHLFGYHVSKH